MSKQHCLSDSKMHSGIFNTNQLIKQNVLNHSLWCLLIVLCCTFLLCFSSNAHATDTTIDAKNESIKYSELAASRSDSANNTQESSEQPSNIVDYVKQELTQEQKTPETVTLKTQVNNALSGDYNESFYELEELNSGLPQLDPPPNLQTPLATLEFFNTAMMEKDFALASYALNLNSIDPAEQVNVGRDLSKKLDYLLSDKSLYLFEELPDRADGLIEPAVGSSNPIKGIPRRSIKLGYIDYKKRKVPIYIERVHTKDSSPSWVFSSQTVNNIERLYDMHKPAEIEKYMPSWLTKKFFGVSVWEGILLIIIMALTFIIGYVISKGIAKLIAKYTAKLQKRSESEQLSLHNKGLTDLLSKLTVPFTTTISFGLIFAMVSGVLPNVHSIATSTRPIIWVGLVFSTLWLGIRAINFFANRYQDFQIDSLDDEKFNEQRVRMTYLSIFRRIFIFVMIIGGLWVSLAEFADLEGLGTTLLTSAGIAGAVIGIAAQPTLGNIIAGFQVAITQPVRIGDTIMLDGIWSEVEDLRYTYAVIKTWDERRLIVPMKYFVTEILENWSHTSSKQSSAVYLYVDYGVDIDAIRDKFFDLLKSHELWDNETEPNLLVTSVTEDTIKLRCKVSSDSPLHAWQLECDIRRQMLDYLAAEQRDFLPTERITLAARGNDS